MRVSVEQGSGLTERRPLLRGIRACMRWSLYMYRKAYMYVSEFVRPTYPRCRTLVFAVPVVTARGAEYFLLLSPPNGKPAPSTLGDGSGDCAGSPSPFQREIGPPPPKWHVDVESARRSASAFCIGGGGWFETAE